MLCTCVIIVSLLTNKGADNNDEVEHIPWFLEVVQS